MTSNALEKRIKRHVTGRVRDYFVIMNPGIDSGAVAEGEAILTDAERVVPALGGLEFTGKLTDCRRANLFFRTATRVLMRIETFRSERFDRLEKKLFEIPWELYLKPDSPLPEISVTARRSRLYHSDAVADRVRAAIADALPTASEMGKGADQNGEDSELRQRIFVRALEDHFTVSIDSSGEPLYKRGIKVTGGMAPLRESIGAAILRSLGFTGDGPLVDPMCGTGTFSLEGAMIAADVPAGLYRRFAFEGWPAHVPRRWESDRAEAAALIRPQSGPHQIFASDLDGAACSRLQETIAKINLLSDADGHPRWADAIGVGRVDFFDLLPKDLTAEKGTLLLNPPYGLRMGDLKKSRQMYAEIFGRLLSDWKGWRVALIAPDKRLILPDPGNGKTLFRERIQSFSHGGLKVFLLTGIVK